MTNTQPLVVTPRPFSGECLKGFILRTSEANGYDTPSDMLAAAGMSYNEMRAIIPPIEKLAPLYDRPQDEFHAMGYLRPWEQRFEKHAPILHHSLPSAYLAIKRPRVCPECVIEKGCIEGFWDLKHAVACPIHGREALFQCPSCGNRLDWFRPGLLRCKCGCDLATYRGNVVENEPILGLLQILRSKLHGEPLDYSLLRDHLGFPVSSLEDMSLATLIGIIGRLEGRKPNGNARYSADRRQPSAEQVLSIAAGALAHWPHGLYDYLRSLNPEGGSKKGFGLRKQFESFFGSLFKSGLPEEEIAFLRDAFVRFGTEEWRQGYVTQALDRNTGLGQRLVGIYGLAKALGVMPSTARTMVARGEIQGVPVTANGRTRMLFDLAQPLPFVPSVGESLPVRKAAAKLGLPVSVLKVLREEGVFEVRHRAKPASAYHALDLEAFRRRMLAALPDRLIRSSSGCMTFAEVMATKTGNPEIKAAFVTAMLNGSIAALGQDAQGNGAVFERVDAENFLRLRKEKHFDSMTVVAAAKLLHCDPVVVKHMFLDGVLAGEKKPRGIFLDSGALRDFAEQYISCAAIAAHFGTQSGRIVERCEGQGITIRWCSRGDNRSQQPFVGRQAAEKAWGSLALAGPLGQAAAEENQK